MRGITFYTVRTFIVLGFWTLVIIPLLLVAYAGFGRIRYYMSRWWAYRVLWAAGVRLDVQGLENLEGGGPYIYAPNHQSYMDIPVIMRALPIQFRVVANQELFAVPVLGFAIGLMGTIGISRESRREAVKSLRRAEQRVRKGDNLLIFPEGRLSDTEEFEPFKKGAFLIAKRLGVPVVPVCIVGTHRILARGSRAIHPGRVKVIVLKPRKTEGDLDEVATTIQAELEGEFREAARSLG
ncbi:MAG: lysophospholipid acyltransferase family protein [bacterium]